jgi:hypothetical protein
MTEVSATSSRHNSDNPYPAETVAATSPLLRRAVRGRRLPESLQTAIRLDRRTIIGREATAFRAGLVRHVGSSPSETQKAMINLAVQLRMRLLAMDASFTDRGDHSAHDSKQYLAWANSLSRIMVRLGLEPAAQRPLNTPEILAKFEREKAARAAEAARAATL